MASEKDQVIHDERDLKPTKWQRVKRHYKKWWWVHLILVIIVVLVTTLPIIYVAYPKIAKDNINKASLEVDSMTITDPTPDSVELGFTQTLLSNSSYHPTLYPFNASFYLLDNPNNPPFASIETVEIHASNGTQSTIPPQTVNITHMDEFTRYVLLALASEEFTIALRGKGDLKQGGLPKTSVDYNKNITMKGFNSLKDFSLTEFHVLNETRADGTNAVGTASIYNPTVMTIDLGTVTFAMSVNGTPIGSSTIDSLVLKPGDNLVDMRAEVYQLVVVGIVIKRQNAILPVDIVGNQSVYNGEVIPYYTTMLEASHLSIELNVTKSIEGTSFANGGGGGLKRSLFKVPQV